MTEERRCRCNHRGSWKLRRAIAERDIRRHRNGGAMRLTVMARRKEVRGWQTRHVHSGKCPRR